MQFPHLFEFMDQAWVPSSLRQTLREILSCGNARPFRSYYGWVAGEVRRLVTSGGYENVVELGAGTAPITRVLAEAPDLGKVRLIVCDYQPDETTYSDLERRYPERVTARRESVDFSVPQTWPPRTLLVLSGTFHHISTDKRPEVLETLRSSAEAVVIAEPLRRTLLSVAFVFLSTIPAIVLPLWYLGRPGRLRRLLWCWLLPVAPAMFWWDGVASCLRMWSEADWHSALGRSCRAGCQPAILQSAFCQIVSISGMAKALRDMV